MDEVKTSDLPRETVVLLTKNIINVTFQNADLTPKERVIVAMAIWAESVNGMRSKCKSDDEFNEFTEKVLQATRELIYENKDRKE
jgi:hypothetical protein